MSFDRKMKNEGQTINIAMPDFKSLMGGSGDGVFPDPELYDYYREMSQREIWISGEIDDSAVRYAKAILRYNQEDEGIPAEERKPIKVVLDTCGGDVTVMWTIITMIEKSVTPVYTINFSQALSAGSYILAAGHRRFAFPGAVTLIHSGSVGINGDKEKVESAQKFFNALTKKASDFLLSKTKIDPRVMKKKAPNDWYLDADEALEVGLVDAIIYNFDEKSFELPEKKEEANEEQQQ